MPMFGIMKRLTVSLSKLVSVDTYVCGGGLNLRKVLLFIKLGKLILPPFGMFNKHLKFSRVQLFAWL